jgi:hypothetical protein
MPEDRDINFFLEERKRIGSRLPGSIDRNTARRLETAMARGAWRRRRPAVVVSRTGGRNLAGGIGGWWSKMAELVRESAEGGEIRPLAAGIG